MTISAVTTWRCESKTSIYQNPELTVTSTPLPELAVENGRSFSKTIRLRNEKPAAKSDSLAADAAHYQLVTPYSGAVILETEQQFADVEVGGP